MLTYSQMGAIKDFADLLKSRFDKLEWKANTTRKTMRIEEVADQIDWILHDVTKDLIEEVLIEVERMGDFYDQD